MWADIRKYRETPEGRKVTTKQIKKLVYKKMYNNFSKQLSEIRKTENQIYKSTSMTASEKRLRLGVTRHRKNEIAKKAVSISKNMF